MKEEPLIQDGKRNNLCTMNKFYTKERNVQLLIQLLKDNGIKKVIASPGTVNMPFVGSIQNDPFFEIFSCVDERSAAYMACGLSVESGEPVVISCTGATASRNYFSALTEAFYRKIPIIAVTSTPTISWTGNNFAQFIDRSSLPRDVAISSYLLRLVKDADDEWDCTIKINRGLLEMKRNGGGPVHFNLESMDSYDFSIKDILPARNIIRYTYGDSLPNIHDGKVAIFIGSHHKFSQELTEIIDSFCLSNDCIVLCDHTSGYYGQYKVLASLFASQAYRIRDNYSFDLVIHLGEVSGDYYTTQLMCEAKEIWRVSEDGQIRDTFKRLTSIFDMPEDYFFKNIKSRCLNQTKQYSEFCQLYESIISMMPTDIPYSNIWMARVLSEMMPSHSVIHLGILNTLRSWNFFKLPNTVSLYCNVGGFGIDGGLSTLLGASLSSKDRLYFGIIGDLAFFYDINCLANRHVNNNIRILLINNGKGVEFCNKSHPGSAWGESANLFFAAEGHFGRKSKNLVKGYAESLGFKYISASNKEEFLKMAEEFVEPLNENSKPIIFETFVESSDDVAALHRVVTLLPESGIKGSVKRVAKRILNK